MRIIPLSEGSFTIDHTKVFVPFDTSTENLQHRPKGSILVEIQPFVVITDQDIILFDTGLGYFNSNGILQIHDNLMKVGIDPSTVTKVCMSHLHKDHAGGLTYIEPNNKERYISFPYAKHYIQKKEFDLAISGTNPSYLSEQVAVLENFSGVIWLEQDQGIIDDSIEFLHTGGHSQYHQVFWIKEAGSIFFFGGDEAPQLMQMKSKFIAKYDLDGKKAMQWRQSWWEQGSQEKWTFAFYHDIQFPTYIAQ
jgi:glyoxylase-like metal-dependent hydrolase (beta-lactamase superfamily II)